MNRHVLTGLSLALLTLGCHSYRDQQQAIRFHDDGRAKIAIALTPVYDPQHISLPWSLAEDLTYQIQNRLLSKSHVFISNPLPSPSEINTKIDEGAAPVLSLQRYDENTSLNIHQESLKVKFPHSEFVVFLELAQHNIHPKVETDKFFDKLSPSYSMDLAMRIRIYDLRGETPKVVLQELIEQKHLIPKQFATLDQKSSLWGKKTYSISPMGFAHTQFAKEVTRRIESYLILAKTQ